MLKRVYPFALASLVGLGAFALPVAGASAAAIPAVQQSAAGADQGAGLYQDVRDTRVVRKKIIRYDRNQHGARYRNRNGRYHYYHNGYYYASPWWLLAAPLVIGGAIIAGQNDDDYGDHVSWCSNRYRSYNPRTDTWVSYSGRVNRCNSPYN